MSAAKMRIVPKNDHDDATLLTRSATPVSTCDSINTQNSRRGAFLRTIGAGPYSETWLLPESRVASHFSMWRHLNHSGNVRLQLFSDAGASISVYDSGAHSCVPYVVDPDGYVWSNGDSDPFQDLLGYYLWFPEKTYRSYTISFTGSASEGFWQVGRFWIGRYWELWHSPGYGTLQFGQDTIADSARSQAGSRAANLWAVWRRVSFELTAMREWELPSWWAVRQYNSVAREVVVSMYPDDGDQREALHTLAGNLAALNDIGRPTSVLSMRAQVEES